MSSSFESIYTNMSTDKLFDIVENPVLHGQAQVTAAQFELSKRNVSVEDLMRMKMVRNLQKDASKSVSSMSKKSNSKPEKGLWGFLKSLFS